MHIIWVVGGTFIFSKPLNYIDTRKTVDNRKTIRGKKYNFMSLEPGHPLVHNYLGCSFTVVKADKANVNGNFDTCNFHKSRFRGANFTRPVFEDCKFEGVNFDQVSFHYAEFTRCNLSGANFTAVKGLATCKFTNCVYDGIKGARPYDLKGRVILVPTYPSKSDGIPKHIEREDTQPMKPVPTNRPLFRQDNTSCSTTPLKPISTAPREKDVKPIPLPPVEHYRSPQQDVPEHLAPWKGEVKTTSEEEEDWELIGHYMGGMYTGGYNYSNNWAYDKHKYGYSDNCFLECSNIGELWNK